MKVNNLRKGVEGFFKVAGRFKTPLIIHQRGCLKEMIFVGALAGTCKTHLQRVRNKTKLRSMDLMMPFLDSELSPAQGKAGWFGAGKAKSKWITRNEISFQKEMIHQ